MPFSRFVSIDIETTGLEPESCDIIEIGAVIDDWIVPIKDPPTFHCYVKRAQYKGHPYALSMHPTIFRRIATEEPGYMYLYPREAGRSLGAWMENNGAYHEDADGRDTVPRANVAGKNFASFDDKFLRLLPDFDQYVRYRHRIIDPSTMYWNPLEDSVLPGTKTCMERAGLEGEVAHTALEDAKVVAKIIQIYVGRTAGTLGLLKVYKERGVEVPDWLDDRIDDALCDGSALRGIK